MNYFNYFTEIENFYQVKRESFTLVSSLDWVLIESWKEQGIPLEIVLKGGQIGRADFFGAILRGEA